MRRMIPILLTLVAATTASAASLEFDFTSSLLYTQAGVPVTFSGTLTNTGATDVYLNADNVTSVLPFDDFPFLLNTPPILGPGASITADLLQVLPGPGLANGLYAGVFTILGGDTPASLDPLSQRTFAVQVVPEPATWISALGLVPLLVLRRRRH